MPSTPSAVDPQLVQRIDSHLRAGDYRSALGIAESLAATIDSPDVDHATGSEWIAVCRARREMGRFAEAEAAGLHALSSLAVTVGREHPLYATGLRELARTYEELGQFAQAESLDRQAFAIRRRVLGSEHPDTGQSLSDLSPVVRWLGRYAESEACAAEAVAIFARPEHARHPARPLALINLAFALTCRGNNRAAVETATEAHQLAVQLFAPRHPELATVGGLLARLLLVGFRTEQAEHLLATAVETRREALGESHPHHAAMLMNLAALRRNQGRLEDAERILRDAVRIAEGAFGGDHVRAADVYDRLAGILTERGSFVEAERLCRKTIAIYERALGADNAITLDTRIGLARLLTLTGRAEEAVSLCRDLLDRYTPECPTGISDVRDGLARALGAQGHLTAATAEAATALQILRELPGVAVSWLTYSLALLAWYQLETGDVAAGVASAKEAFDLTVADAGPGDDATLEAARSLASAYQTQGDSQSAERVLRGAMAGAPKAVKTIDLRLDLARALAAQAKDQEAEELYLTLVAERRRGGSENPLLADALVELGSFYEEGGNLGAAVPRYREALDIRRAVEGPDGIGVARTLHTLAALHHRAGALPAAMEGYKQALDAYRASAGEDSVEFAVCQHAQALLYLDLGDPAQAESTIRTALQKLARRGARNAEHLAARQGLATILAATGKYSEAREILLEVLAINRKNLVPTHVATLGVASELAGIYLVEGDLLAAESLIREVAQRHREQRPPNDATIAFDEGRLAQLYTRLGEYEPARRHGDRYLALIRRSEGENSPAYALGLLLLADVHLLEDDYAAAMKVTREALGVRRRVFGESNLPVVAALHRLAALECDLGWWNDARAHAADATAIVRRLLGPDSPGFASALRTEAAMNAAAPDTAGELLARAVVLERRCYGDHNPARVPGLLERADWHLHRREYPPAEELLLEAARILRHAGTEENLVHAGIASRLATVLMYTNRQTEAGRYFLQAFDIAGRLLGPEHPDATASSRQLAWWHLSQGAPADALAAIEGAIAGEDEWTALAGDAPVVFARFKSAFDAILTDRFRIAVLAHLPDANPEAAYRRLLSDRTREAALVAGSPLARLATGSADRAELLTRWRRLRVQLVEMTLAGPGFDTPESHFARLGRWRQEERRLAAEFPSAPAVSPPALADALPPNSTLVEFVRVAAGFEREDRSRYVAFVLPAGDVSKLRLIDLGSAAVIDRLTAEWSEVLTQGPDARELAGGRQLADRLLAPLLPHLGTGEELFLVLDSRLRTVPFAALPVATGQRVVDRFAVTVLTHAAGILGTRPLSTVRNAVVVVEAQRGGLLAWLRRMITGDASGGAALAARLDVPFRPATGRWLSSCPADVVHVAVPGVLEADPPFEGSSGRLLDPLARYGVRWGSLRASATTVRDLNLVPGATVVLPETIPAPGAAGAEALTWVSRAFRHAGADAAIVGLWRTPHAEELWVAFHRERKTGSSPAIALRQAQLHLTRLNPAPSTWAGLVCIAG